MAIVRVDLPPLETVDKGPNFLPEPLHSSSPFHARLYVFTKTTKYHSLHRMLFCSHMYVKLFFRM